jgi:hypothetical protein
VTVRGQTTGLVIVPLRGVPVERDRDWHRPSCGFFSASPELDRQMLAFDQGHNPSRVRDPRASAD